MLDKIVEVDKPISKCYVNSKEVQPMKVSEQIFKNSPGLRWNGFAVAGIDVAINYADSQNLQVTIPEGVESPLIYREDVQEMGSHLPSLDLH